MRIVAAVLYAITGAVLTALAFAMAGGSLRPSSAALSLALGAALGAWSLWAERRRPWSWPRLTLWEGAAIAAFAAFSVRAFGWVVYFRGDEVRVLSANNLGDLPLHVTYVRFFADGATFWPENPILAGAKLTYPIGVDLLHSLFLLLGMDLWHGFVWMGLIGALLTGISLWHWGRAFSLVGILANGGLFGFAILHTWSLEDYQAGQAWKSFALALLLTQRGLLFALPAGLALLSSWRARFFGQGAPILPRWGEWLLYAAMPVFHLHTFIVLSWFLLAWFIMEKEARRPIAQLVAAAFLPATLLVWLVTNYPHGPSALGWHAGWMQDDDGYLDWCREHLGLASPRAAALLFWPLNFGFLPILLAFLVARARSGSRWLRASLFPALGLFALCCFVKFAVWPWDNTKLMIWSYLIVLPLLWEDLLVTWRPWLRAAAIVLLFGSGAISTLGGLRGEGYAIASRSELQALAPAVSRLPPNARVMADPTYEHPLLLLGHPLALGYVGHVWSHGYDYRAPLEAVTACLNGEPDWREQARAVDAHYLFWGRLEEQNFPGSAQPWRESARLIAHGSWGELYDLDAAP